MINEVTLIIKKVEDISGEDVGGNHAKSILLTFIDPVTRQHTASLQGKKTDYTMLKKERLEFINNATGGGCVPMQIGRLAADEAAKETPPENGNEDWPEWPDDQLSALNDVRCYHCCGKGHYAANCPSKGSSKGKDTKGYSKSKGKGGHAPTKGKRE